MEIKAIFIYTKIPSWFVFVSNYLITVKTLKRNHQGILVWEFYSKLDSRIKFKNKKELLTFIKERFPEMPLVHIIEDRQYYQNERYEDYPL